MSVLSEKVVTLSKPYLGPATEGFLNRQCTSHLKMDMSGLATVHLRDLAKWVEVSAGLLMDQTKAAELAKKIAALK